MNKMGDWSGLSGSEPYAWTGGAAILGRLMYHATQVQKGKRKPWSAAVMFDLPIALGLGWAIYGICVYFDLSPEPTVSAAIVGSYLGPYTLDRVFARIAEKYFPAEKNNG